MGSVQDHDEMVQSFHHDPLFFHSIFLRDERNDKGVCCP